MKYFCLAFILAGLASLAHGQAHVYFSIRDSIYRADADGSNVTEWVNMDTAVGDGSWATRDILSVGNQLFWIAGNSIFRANANGSEVTEITPSTSLVHGLATDGTHLYFGNGVNLFRASTDGSVLETRSHTYHGSISSIVVGDYYYEANTNGGSAFVSRTALDGSGTETIFEFDDDLDDTFMRGLSSDGAQLYIAAQLHNAVFRMDLDGANAVSFYDTYFPWALEVYGDVVYTVAFGGDGILSTSIGGTQSELFLDYSDFNSGFAYDVHFANLSAVPEPSTYAMIAGVAMLGFAVWRRSKSRRAVSTES